MGRTNKCRSGVLYQSYRTCRMYPYLRLADQLIIAVKPSSCRIDTISMLLRSLLPGWVLSDVPDGRAIIPGKVVVNESEL